MHAGVVQSDIKFLPGVQHVPVELCLLSCQYVFPLGQPLVASNSTPEAAKLEQLLSLEDEHMREQDHTDHPSDFVVPSGRNLHQTTVEHWQIWYQVLQTSVVTKERMNILQEPKLLSHQFEDKLGLYVSQEYYENRIEEHDIYA